MWLKFKYGMCYCKMAKFEEVVKIWELKSIVLILREAD
jgi:hypothetical protein